MATPKVCVFLVLCCLTCLFECPSGMRLKKRDVEAQTGTTMDSTVTPVPSIEKVGTSGDHKVPETTMEDEEESTQTESSEESDEENWRPRHHKHHHGDKQRFPDMHTSFMFNSPMFNIRQMEEYFRQLEKTMYRIFQQTMEEAEQYPNVVSNTTTEEVTIDGKKYQVEKTIVKGGSDNSTIIIKSVSIVPSEQTNSTIADM